MLLYYTRECIGIKDEDDHCTCCHTKNTILGNNEQQGGCSFDICVASLVDCYGEGEEPLQGHCDDELLLLRNILRVQHFSGSFIDWALMK